ncbi:hypothetical protein BATDEDRAFT_25854 [Batrachochytrium dendrobatidis JAM81]|uniref:Arrestin C-terminal-like domain-containing protein n=2 Tax=Batrachochytrium dendrobatidis TaxID=109871 RepID=F4P5U3_BATDJ|nr:uncharacterized protein BATDEDRAFT_25854 [Batrachochytrium dendrobatidis JAM81]EGF79484.1 hypothetical protein BATDEDRAFT_25854 [Batrachochytrium dendrobatidis JAM81]OAJ42800.1 hypothetical protein BDEG_26211 [Batrachochytrium dendrobatidis JEL423]|eukprot:XP_006679899.1 hypothetical protein BATDEDRAFT_25854 [Batrachochytrium dendrobatidis JAM81]
MSDWHSNPLPGARQSRTYADTSDSIDEDCDTTTSSPHRISSQLQQDGKASLTPRQLSEFVISNPVSKIPPFEYYPRQVRSSLKHISTNVSLSKTLFTTGEAVTGKIEVSCTKENEHTKIGKIHVYLIGIEETFPQKTNKPNQRLFLSKRLLLQDVTRAPTDAVYASSPDENGMWRAKKGTTVLNFSIEIQSDTTSNPWIYTEQNAGVILPSSYWNKRLGGIRYIVAGVVYPKVESKDCFPIASYRDVNVVESAHFQLQTQFSSMLPPTSPLFKEISSEVKPNLLNIGKKGNVKLAASIRVPQADNSIDTGTWLSGGIGFVGIDIQNGSAKPVTKLSVSLIRRVKTFSYVAAPSNNHDPNRHIDDDRGSITMLSFVRTVVSRRKLETASIPLNSGIATLSSKFQGGGFVDDNVKNAQNTKGFEIWSGVKPGASTSFVLDINVPTISRSISNGRLIDVSFFVQVKVTLKGQSKIRLDFPITILHPASFYTKMPAVELNIADIVSNDESAQQALKPEQNHSKSIEMSKAEDTRNCDLNQFDDRQDTFVTSSRQSISDGSIPSAPPIAVAADEKPCLPNSPTHGSIYSMLDRVDHPRSRDDMLKTKSYTTSKAATFGYSSNTQSPVSLKYPSYTPTASKSGTISSQRGSKFSPTSLSRMNDFDGLGLNSVPLPPSNPPMLSIIKQQRIGANQTAALVKGPSEPAPTRRLPPPPPPTVRIPVNNDLNNVHSLEGVPRLDLVQEIDKLFACVAVE